jgi:phosphatidylinositol alpha-mannosyltransferase
MRVALVSGYDWEVFGGVQSQVRDLARQLRRLGETVLVLSPGRPPATGEEQHGLLETAGRAISVPANGSRAPISPGPAAFGRTLARLSAFVPEVVHVHEPLLPGPPLAALLFSPAPVVGTFHRAGADALYRLEGHLLKGPARRRMKAVTAVSPAARETAEEVLGPFPSLVELPNGVDLARFEALRLSRSSTFKDPAGPLLACLGRLEDRKGLAVLLDAMRLLGRPCRLVVIGDGPARAELELQAASIAGVSFLGALPDEEAARLVAAADCFVAPALRGESFGIVLLEAMAAGTAVAASDIPGYSLAAGGAAQLFPPGDAAALAETLRRLLSDRARREELVAAGLARAARCSITEVARGYVEIYRSVVASPRSSRAAS